MVCCSLAKMACGYFDGVFVDSRPLSAANAELAKLELCSGGLASHHLQPLKSTWHQGLISTATLHCIPLAFVDLRSLATGGDMPEVCCVLIVVVKISSWKTLIWFVARTANQAG
jgi:hypothetical protein